MFYVSQSKFKQFRPIHPRQNLNISSKERRTWGKRELALKIINKRNKGERNERK